MTALKKWFSGNDAQQSTIDSMLDDLSVLKLDETATSHGHIKKSMDIVESLSTIGEEIPLQNARNLFLNNTIDLCYD